LVFDKAGIESGSNSKLVGELVVAELFTTLAFVFLFSNHARGQKLGKRASGTRGVPRLTGSELSMGRGNETTVEVDDIWGRYR
jgi:hypothetical protein